MHVSSASAVNSAVLTQAARSPLPQQPPEKPETNHTSGETSHQTKTAGGLDIKV